jgi:hypothetical protein
MRKRKDEGEEGKSSLLIYRRILLLADTLVIKYFASLFGFYPGCIHLFQGNGE